MTGTKQVIKRVEAIFGECEVEVRTIKATCKLCGGKNWKAGFCSSICKDNWMAWTWAIEKESN